MEKYGKTAVFPGGYGRIGEIQHGRLRPDWGLKGYHRMKKEYNLPIDVSFAWIPWVVRQVKRSW